MCCLDCFKKLTHSNFYNFNHPLNEIVIMNNKNIHTQQPVFEKNTYLYNKYNNLIPPYKVHNESLTIPKIIINDTDEEIIYDKFTNNLNKILLNKIKVIKNNNMKYKQEILEKFLKNNKNEFENLQGTLRNRKNKIDVIENIEWDIVE